MKLVVSIGGTHPATVVETREMSWDEYVVFLQGMEPVFTNDKASRGWSCPAKFSPAYRDSENFIARYALTFDYDRVTPEDLKTIFRAYKGYVFCAYKTWSHTDENPRFRFIFPLSRGVTYDEFQAISRKVASKAGIELAARESHVPAQMMFLPTFKPGTNEQGRQFFEGVGRVIDADKVLATYKNWTDRKEWPHRKEGDGVHNEGEGTDPTEKPGLIGAWCRAYSIEDVIEKFNLPYEKVR